MGELLERVVASFNDNRTNLQITARRLQRTVAATAFVLILATWKLWTPNSVYPQVPLFRWAEVIPAWIEWSLLGVLPVSLLVAMDVGFTKRWSRRALIVYVLATAVLVAANQHRLQPWAYEFVVLAAVLALAPPRNALVMIRLLVISIYFYSAVSKLDYSFVHTHGQQFLLVVFQSVGLSIDDWSDNAKHLLAACIPIAELAVGIALCLPRLRRWGLSGSLLMHGLLLVVLGPWGLDHKPGVLIWNVYFIIQNILLFGPIYTRAASSVRPHAQSADSNSSETVSTSTRIGSQFAAVSVTAVLVLPLLEPYGCFDHWPAWAVYAARTEKLKVYVHESQRERLPSELKQHVERPRFDSKWCRVYIDRWSLSELNAPIYPQQRFQLGVALAVARTYDLDSHLTVICESAADRRKGTRTSHEVFGSAELTQEAQRFWLNAIPREERP